MGLVYADELPDFSKTKLWDLEQRKLEIKETLNGLAIPSLNSGVGAVGYRSQSYEDPEHEEWVQVDLLEFGKVDAIVLVPTLWRDTQLGFIADNVPDEFRLVAGTKKHPEGEIIYEHSVAKNAFIGIAPLFLLVSRDEVFWVRVEVSRLAARHFDGRYIFQLSELMVFDGDVNRALRKPVSSSWRVDESASWNGTVLVDGVLPYLMNSATGEQSRAYVSPVGVGEKPSITIDLGKTHEVDGLRLYAADQSDTVPAANAGEFGLPEHFILEGANREDFSDASFLLEAKMQSIFEMGPILSWNFPVQKVRYVRVTALVPFLYSGRVEGTRISFTEIEILSQGKNLAKGKPVTASFDISKTRHPISTLTDGRNLYGDILPQRKWLEQLAFRHKLEQELAALELELDSRYVFPFDLVDKNTGAKMLSWQDLTRPNLSLGSNRGVPDFQKVYWQPISEAEFMSKRPFQLGDVAKADGKVMLTFELADNVDGRFDPDGKSVQVDDSIAGIDVKNGLQVHSQGVSEVSYFLNGAFTTFSATLIPCYQASSVFEVYADGKKVFESDIFAEKPHLKILKWMLPERRC